MARLRDWASKSYDSRTGHAGSSLTETGKGGYAPGNPSSQIEQTYTRGENGAPPTGWCTHNATQKHAGKYAPRVEGAAHPRDHDGSNNRDGKAGGY
jgi:hypothetical protein